MPMLVRETYARNLFRVMREFKLTPASPDFYNMTPEQMDFMVASLNQDVKEEQLALNHKEETSFVYDPDFEWDKDMDYGGEKHDEDQIRKLLGKEGYEKREQIYQDAIESVKVKEEQDKQEQQDISSFIENYNNQLIEKTQKQSSTGFAEDDEDIDTI